MKLSNTVVSDKKDKERLKRMREGKLRILRKSMAEKEGRLHIEQAAYDFIRKNGFKAGTQVAIAEAAGVSRPLVSMRTGGMPSLRDKLVGRAIAKQDLVMIGQAARVGHPMLLHVPAAIIGNALEALDEFKNNER